MNNPGSHLIALCLLGFFFGPYPGQAQGAEVQFPSGNASWTVRVKYHSQSGSPAPTVTPASAPPGTPVSFPTPAVQVVISKVDVTQTGNLCRSIVTWSDAKVTESWWLKSPPWVLFDRQNPPDIIVMTDARFLSDFRPDASMFSWLDSQSFTDKKSFQGKPCDYYQKVFPPFLHPPGVEPIPVLHEAWVDAKTGLPAAVDNSVALYVFTFNPPPSDPLTLPERFQKELERVQDSIPNPKYLGKPRSWGKP